jgi:hypothetical protein
MSFNFYRPSSKKKAKAAAAASAAAAAGEGVEMNSQAPEAYGAVTVRTPTEKAPPPTTKSTTGAQDSENTIYVAVATEDDLESRSDNTGSEHYDMCFVAKLSEPLTQDELDALAKQENNGAPGPLDDAVNRSIKGPLTGPLREKEASPHHVPLHQVDDLVERMHQVGLETRKYLSVQNDEVFVLIRAPLWLLRKVAESTSFLVECEPDRLRDLAGSMKEKFPGKGIDNFAIPESNELLEGDSYYAPYDHCYMPYKDETKQGNESYRGLWCEYDTPILGKCPFGTVARIKLIRGILNRRGKEGGCEMDLARFGEHPDWFVFPLHSEAERKALNREWIDRLRLTPFWMQPVKQMQLYLGEQVTIYFAFLGSHCRWLFWLGITGLFVEGVALFAGSDEQPLVGWFALAVALWAACFIEFWKRRESTLQMHWGMSDFEATEEVRIQFINEIKGQEVPNPVTGELEFAERPYHERFRKKVISNCVTFACIAAILFINVVVYWLKLYMRDSEIEFVATWYKTIFSIVLSVTISVVNLCYVPIAQKLTAWENNRTDTEHQDSLIYKQFAVQFISSYASLAYTAFLQNKFEGSCDGMPTCMDDLMQLVGTILVERFVFTILYDNVLPRLTSYYKLQQETEGADVSKMTSAELEYILEPFDFENEIMARFLDQVLMFGYMVLFVVALPLAPFFGYFGNLLQINQYGHLMLFHKQRCMPFGAQDIGSFQYCFEMVAGIATFTNAALVFFTMRDVYFQENFPQSYVMWLFFGTIGSILYIMSLVRDNTDDVPEAVSTQLERQSHLRRKIYDLTPDDEKVASEPVSFSLHEHHKTGELVQPRDNN